MEMLQMTETETPSENGHVIIEGRPHGAMRLVTLANGVVVSVKYMNLSVAQQVMKSVASPQAPVVEVLRPDGTTEQVANTLDPDYIKQTAAIENEKFLKLVRFASGLYVRLHNAGSRGLTDEQREELLTLEEAMRAETGLEIAGRTEEQKFLNNLAFTTPDDYSLVIAALFAQAENPK